MNSVIDVVKRVHERHRSIVPNLTTLGYFNDKLQMIAFPSLTRDEWRRGLRATDPSARVKVYPLLAHELRHWFDFVGTLWGQARLIRLFNALNVRMQNNPNHFAPIVAYFNDMKKVFLLDYFTTVTEDPAVLTSRVRWKYMLTCGRRFEADGSMSINRRLLFMRFMTHEGVPVSRTPLSVASLLETGAMQAELEADIAILRTVPDEESHSFEEEHITPRHNFLYDPRMTAYSVAAHAVSNVLGLGDPLPTYAIAAGLAHVCLNLPASLYSSIDTPEALEPFGDANDCLKQECEPAYAFLALLYHFATLNGQSNSPDSPQGDEFALAGLPTFTDIESLVIQEMRTLRENIVDGPFCEYLDALLDYGLEVYKTRGLRGSKLSPLEAIGKGLFIPPIMLADYGPFTLSTDDDIWQDCDARWLTTMQVLESMEEFERVCGV